MTEPLKDSRTGISIRFIESFDPNPQSPQYREVDELWLLAMSDHRDVSFMQKLWDARDYLRERKAQAGHSL